MDRKNRMIIGGILMTLLFLTGCGNDLNDEDLMTQEGYIVEISEERILVISHIEPEDIDEMTIDELLEKSTEDDGPSDLSAVWYAVDNIEELSIGQRVRVSTNLVLDSWPQQGEAIELDILEGHE